jgi:seryl-tRNA synthetase
MVSTSKVDKAIQYYSQWYTMIDVPMVVDLDVSTHTTPISKAQQYHSKGKVYIASAEQSFLQLHKDGNLPTGKYMALTPCYRDEVTDSIHLKVFLKLELISVAPDGSIYEELSKVAGAAFEFFSKYLPVRYLKTKEGVDIISVVGGYELGSYGIRNTLNGCCYVYGTGIAEPRLSTAIKTNNEDD